MRRPQSALLPYLGLGGLLLILLMASYWLGQRLEERERQRAEERLTYQASSLARQLEGALQEQVDDLHLLALLWTHHGRMSHDEWQLDAGFFLRTFTGYQALQWSDAELQTHWSVPRENSEAVRDFRLSPGHPSFAAASQARDSGEPRLSDSFEMPRGGRGLVLYFPVYIKDDQGRLQFDGFMQGVFRVGQLMESLLAQTDSQRFCVRMLEHGQSIYANEQPDREHEPVLRTQLNLLGNHSFELELSPSDSLAAYLFTPLPKVVFWAASLISLLLVAALGLAMENARRARVLSATNLQLNRTAQLREEVERRLRDSRENLQLALDLTDSSRDSLFVFDIQTRELLHMNRATHSSLGYDADEFRRLLRDTPERLIPGYFAWLEQVREAHQQNLSMIFQHEMLRRDGSPQAAEINAQLIRQGGGEYLIAVARDNSERLQLEAQLQILTLQDSLTGLYNRRYFDHKLHSEWRRLRRSEQPLALLMLDVDHFKLFNDCRGHLAGDDALRQIATAMAACMQREGDAACRYGGEEFAIILADTGLEGASHVAERVHEQVAELKISHPECNLGYLTVSIGLAIATPGGNGDPQELIALADGALYAAKRQGGNTTCVWSH